MPTGIRPGRTPPPHGRRGSFGLIALAASAGLVSLGLADAQARNCFLDFLGDLNECENLFDNPQLPATQNPEAYTQFAFGTVAKYDSCVRGVPEDDDERQDLWDEYKDNIAACVANFPNDPVTLGICLTAALRGLQIELCILDGGDPIACTPPMMPGRIGARGAGAAGGGADAGGTPGVWMDLIPAMLANPDQPRDPTLLTTADATVTVGLGADGSARPVEEPRARGSLLLAVYHGLGGVVISPVAGDGFAGNGLVSTVDLSRLDLTNDTRVVLIDLWLDGNRRSVRGDVHQFEIVGGAGVGDWDRDGAITPEDLAAFLRSHGAGVARADVNGDGAVDHADVSMFVDHFMDGR